MTAPAARWSGERAALIASYTVGGVSTALACADFGVPAGIIVLAGVIMYSATGELALVAVLSAGGSTATAMLSALLVSARFGVLAAGLSVRLRRVPALERAAAAFLVVDPTVAVAMRETDDRAARRAYWQISVLMGLGWVAGTVLGVVAHAVLGDPRTFGLDAVIPASLIALLSTPMRSRPGLATAIMATVVALVMTPLLPAGLPVLVAVAAVPLGLAVQARGSDEARPTTSGLDAGAPEP